MHMFRSLDPKMLKKAEVKGFDLSPVLSAEEF